MLFLKQALSLVLASTLAISVYGAPVEANDKDIAYALAEAPNGHSEIHSIEKRSPPTELEITAYLTNVTQNNDIRSKIVFWSGVSIEESQRFARSHGRYTLEMLIEEKTEWAPYQTSQEYKGYWPSWDEALRNFWDPASKALAELCINDVYVYLTQERADEQCGPNCTRVWFRKEKPALLRSLHSTDNPRVRSIKKFIKAGTGSEYEGDINSLLG
ncbi:hypothetical protein JDV02_003548 [Purpureocillium takamizusanense]|uniref:Uncharacterized protein n=1 Tax=Purpureocillium takamizusanense TaxID=2060973 RepID=A0A9Q8QD23_9HYPO|nr:uncharacterized protein JDV02_003548 [Purpureocillium takamizusanense]UNI17173.1 hypothetical protein JDV02_003548 [Purpureocillium takamizusanense]